MSVTAWKPNTTARRGPSVEWYTPPEVFAGLGIRFDLDPAAPPGGVPWVPAKRSFSRADDGLRQPWHGRVWLNPPYGRSIGPWLDRLIAHGNGLALVFARTDARWFQKAARQATAICFISGRLRFVSPDGPSGTAQVPSVLLAYGLACAMALAHTNLGHTLVIPQSMTGSKP